jgi:hypothetical protein
VAASQSLVPLPKGAGRLVRGAGPPGTAGQRGPLLMVILPLGGANQGAIWVSPRARARGASDAGGWVRDVAAPGARRRGFDIPCRAARV